MIERTPLRSRWSVTFWLDRAAHRNQKVTDYRGGARAAVLAAGTGLLLIAGGTAAAVPLNAEATSGSMTAQRARAQPLDDGTPGYCPTNKGVTVVVDFNELGGGIVVRCAPGPIGSGYTGLDALEDAGFSPEGTVRWGMQFICRIAGEPAADQKLGITGDPNYKEKCVDTPPAQAFWSYWYAPNGGSWTLSSEGPTNRDVIPGGFEGWSFSLNHTQTTAPAPGIAPERPHQPPHTTAPPTSPTTPPHSSPPSTHPTHGGRGGSGSRRSGGGSSSGTPTAPASTSAPLAPTQPVPPKPGRTRAGQHGSGGSVRATTPSRHSTSRVSATLNPLAVGHNAQGEKVSGNLPASATKGSGGSAAAAVVGILVLAALAGGGYVAYRRRRTDTG